MSNDTMSPMDRALCDWCDAYKEVHGFRARGHNFSTVEEVERDADRLYARIAEQIKEEEIAAASALTRLNATLDTLISSGAADRATALRWWLQAEGADINDYQDVEGRLCYDTNIAYRDALPLMEMIGVVPFARAA